MLRRPAAFCPRTEPRASTRISALALLLSLASACPGAQQDQGERVASGAARGAVVAQVDGVPIGLDEVRELCERTGLAPREALARLEDERLLTRVAAERGYQRAAAVADEGRRALVQALLARDVEAGRGPRDIPLAEVRARFDDAAPRLHLSEDAFPGYEQEIREQLAGEARKLRLEQLLAELRRSFPVQLDEPKVQKLLSDPAVWGGGGGGS
jgi:hypothetical protein